MQPAFSFTTVDCIYERRGLLDSLDLDQDGLSVGPGHGATCSIFSTSAGQYFEGPGLLDSLDQDQNRLPVGPGQVQSVVFS